MAEQSKVYEAFKNYPWETDKVFQQGLESILSQLPTSSSVKEEDEKYEADLLQDARLLQAKHFYFTRFQQNFDLERYLEYEAEKIDRKAGEQQREELFNQIQDYDYDNDGDYTNGLPNIIHGWLEQQSKTGLWDKEKLEMEFLKAKAFYYNARIKSFDVVAFFNWKAKKDEANAPVCPFANLWQNKSKTGPVDQVNGSTFVVVDKSSGTGAKTLTLSSPKSQNVYSVGRLEEYSSVIQDGQGDDRITSFFITATVADSSSPFDTLEHIETKDTKVISSGLAYEETSRLASDSNGLRQVSLEKLGNCYYDLVRYIMGQRKNPKLAVTFSNGQIPLNAVYLTLGLGFMRVITEHTLLNFTLALSHAPIPPLLLLSMARTRTASTAKPLPKGLELYLALAAPEYAKLRGPEILRLGLADVFVPEAKLSDAFETAKKMAVCPAPDTNAAVQLALAIHHTYAGPNRLQVWEDQIELVFGAAESFRDLKDRLEAADSAWSKTILNHWSTLPPVLLNVVFKAVNMCKDKSPFDILALEQKLNAKWRQTEDYNEWSRSKNQWIFEKSQVDVTVDSYFQDLEFPNISADAAVYEAPQETEQELALAVCPVTGQKSSATAACPVFAAKADSAVCPVTGQTASATATCPVSTANTNTSVSVAATCPVTGKPADKSLADQSKCPFSDSVTVKESEEAPSASGWPVSRDRQMELISKVSCPVTGAMESLSLQ
ncbi:hypothetical protein [Parasitella parasitica]|uniref:3-hydroxyisobutyryl-coenzyme A hydrolase n=1 Tax=Parasitella parasitica TaxID=35722 RepID=A0A0B7MZM1_9FUNG|nr:hypothetical protein [Parasitella parasitica]